MKRIWRWLPLVLVVLALFLTSCGGAAPEGSNAGGGSASSGGSTSGGSTSGGSTTGGSTAGGSDSGGDVVITQDNAKQVVDAKVGQKVTVKLPADYDWKVFTTPDIILAPSDTAPSGDVTAVFDAKMMGKATVQSTGSAKCLKDSPPCTKPTIQFDVTVNITQ